MREVVLDTETTGLSPDEGHRIIEIGAVELIDDVPKKHFQSYINPERDVPDEAFKIHGLSTEFLYDKPVFNDIADNFLHFIEGATLVIHNARFDLSFLNAEFVRANLRTLSNPVVDTLQLARLKFPGESVSLDALCRRFSVNTQKRADAHGALIDSEFLSEVYLELTDKKQRGLNLRVAEKEAISLQKPPITQRKALMPSPEEILAHQEILAQLNQPIALEKWLKK